MVKGSQKSGLFKTITSFFPFHLLMAQLRYNLLALFYWIFLFVIVSDGIGSAFGIPLLFYSPEYLGETGFWSFLFLGFAIGGFTMGYNTYSFIRLAPRFPFLNTLHHPFYKFCLNNGILPLLFNLYFIYRFCDFQLKQEFASSADVIVYMTSYVFGFVLFQLLSVLYFFPMNKRVGRRVSVNFAPREEQTVVKTVIPNKDSKIKLRTNTSTKVYYYLGKKFRLYSSRSTRHYKKELLAEIYRQNKVNASLFETIAIVSFLTLGMLQNSRYFEVPAAVSIVLLLTIILMIFSALLSYLDRWAYPVLILVFLGMNFLSVKTNFFTFRNYAYGLSYDAKKTVEYTVPVLFELANNPSYVDPSRKNAVAILDAWKARTGERKPKMIILNVSGGGSRSALWALSCLQNLDKKTEGHFSRHVQMVTGASGGMVGASYYRQLRYLMEQGKLDDLFSQKYRSKISADLLNKLSFSASTNDIFFRYKSFVKNNVSYPVDRGTAFEHQLNENTDNILDLPLSYYTPLEKNATMPLFIFTPTIVNDGRRMLISSQNLSFLMKNGGLPKGNLNSYENVDFMTFFGKCSPEKVSYLSVMRSSATFPFVMPMVTLPTKPGIQLMDAGLRDNYGGKITIDYLIAMNDWIKKNTSGVIIVQLRDTKKILQNEVSKTVSLFDKFTLPFGNMYSNFPRTQDFNQDQILRSFALNSDFPLDIVSFNLRERSKDKISLSWHLTKQEKVKIKKAFDSANNQKAFKDLLTLFK